MFLEFFYYLRSGGLSVTLTEWLVLLQGLRENLNDTSMKGFYLMCRALLVNSETDYDLFDRLFMEFFGDLAKEEELPEDLMDWLDHPDLVPERVKELMKVTHLSEEQIQEMFEKVLKEQTEEHNEGMQWVGTAGHTQYGHTGKDTMGGIRVGGESHYRSAFKVASERKYRDWRKDKIIDSRQFQMAFKKLRQLTDHNLQEKTELDIDETVRKTGDDGGILNVVMKAPRKNIIKLMILIDSGGSMTPHQELCTLLFQSVQKAGNIDHVQFYYFHNAIGDFMYETPDLSFKHKIATDWVLGNISEDYRVIIVSDGEIATYELYTPEQRREAKKGGRPRMRRFSDFKDKYPHLVWLYPQETPTEVTFWTQTWWKLKENFSMYPLTLDGLNDGIKELLAKR